MNLRKKKKRLKKQVESMRAELDAMLKRPAPVVVTHPRVDTLCSQVYFPSDEIVLLDRWTIEDILSRKLCDYIRVYMSMDDPELIPELDAYKCTAKLRVVVPDGGDGF